MPSFNQARFLADALDSVISQDYPHVELIVVDGGSTDGSLEIIEDRSSHISFWRSARDAGQTPALIEGIGRATGALIGWVNSDDVLLPRALSATAEEYVRRGGRSALYGGNYVLIDVAGTVVRVKRHPRNASWFARYGIVPINQPGSFFTRGAYEAVGGLDERWDYVMDTDLYARMSFSQIPYVHIGRFLSGFRIHADSKTVSQKVHAAAESLDAERSWGLNTPAPASKCRGLCLYRMLQVLNGNYLRMTVETLSASGLSWRQMGAGDRNQGHRLQGPAC